uniref:Uncharacterized protein n=1 Tax=Lepisosteus oculatus TaxID=7918 RepID=W5M8M7_LEPOC
KWVECCHLETVLTNISEFLKNEDIHSLFVFSTSTKGPLAATPTPPSALQGKCVVFVKSKTATQLTIENIADNVIVLDTSKNPLKHLDLLLHQVYMPLLCRGESSVVRSLNLNAAGLLGVSHRFMGQLEMIRGHIKGSVVLPIPPVKVMTKARVSPVSHAAFIHLLESTIIGWIKQVKEVLKHDPMALLAHQGSEAGVCQEEALWERRIQNLHYLNVQLDSEAAREILTTLEQANSTYVPALKTMCKDIDKALSQAEENMQFLGSLLRWFELLRSADPLPEIIKYIPPLIHTLLLVWTHSRYYHQPKVFVSLLNSMATEITNIAVRIIGDDVLKDPSSSFHQLKGALKVCATFRGCYLDVKAKADEINTNICTITDLEGVNPIPLTQIRKFKPRCNDVLELVETIHHFQLLETVAEIGGAGTASLDAVVKDIQETYRRAFTSFTSKNMHMLSTSQDQAFEKSFFDFRITIKELEHQIAGVLKVCFQQCPSINSQLRLLEVFQGVISRECVQEQLKDQAEGLLYMLIEEVNQVKTLYQMKDQTPHMSAHTPPIVNRLLWVKGLQSRISEPVMKLKEVFPLALKGDIGWKLRHLYTEVIEKLESLLHLHNRCERVAVESWLTTAEANLSNATKMPLLVVSSQHGELEHNLKPMEVNLDPDFICLLSEASLLHKAPFNIKLSEPVRTMLRSVDAHGLRTLATRLEAVVCKYNEILRTINEFERRLLEGSLVAAQELLRSGLSSYTWSTEETADFVELATSLVCSQLYSAFSAVRNNCNEIGRRASAWSRGCLDVFSNREAKRIYSVQELLQQQERLLELSLGRQISSDGHRIQSLVQESLIVLGISEASPAWQDYMEYIDVLLLKGLKQVTLSSLASMLNTVLEEKKTCFCCAPVLGISVELVGGEVGFSPPLEESSVERSLLEHARHCIDTFLLRAALLATHCQQAQGSYLDYLAADKEVIELTGLILEKVQEGTAGCQTTLEVLSPYAYLWRKDVNETFQDFLNGVGRAERAFLMPEDVKPNTDVPSLEDFDAEISTYRMDRDDILRLQSSVHVGWIKVDFQPIKQVLAACAFKWMWTFAKYLIDKMTDTLENLDIFLKRTEPQLEGITGEEKDTEFFMKMMRLFNEVSARQTDMEGQFIVMQKAVKVLEKYEFRLPTESEKLLTGIPGRWNNLKTRVSLAKQRLSPKIQQESESITKDLAQFGDRLYQLKESIEESDVYMRDCSVETAYHVIKRLSKEVKTLQTEAKYLKELQGLLEAVVVDFRILNECRRTVRNLTLMWQAVEVIRKQQSEWKTQPWQDIDTVQLVSSTSQQLELIKSLAREVHGWDVYAGTLESVNVIQLTLPLIEDLLNPAMRTRHWKQLVRVTGGQLLISPQSLRGMTLGDLLALGLQKHADNVKAIVERASNDIAIETGLKNCEEVWLSRIFDLQPHNRAMSATMTNTEAIFEELEHHQMALDTMKDSSEAGTFLDEVTKWQKKLQIIESIVHLMLQVQDKWVNLEEVLTTSSVCGDLPMEAAVFASVQQDLCSLMKAAEENPNILQICIRQGLQGMLCEMKEKLEKCQHSLLDYLESRRHAFPRLFFLPLQDTLKLICCACNPEVQHHYLYKVFEHMESLIFVKNNEIHEARSQRIVAVKSFAGEQLYLTEMKPLECGGLAEQGLQLLQGRIGSALRSQLHAALGYGQRPQRKMLLFDSLRQVARIATQINFTRSLERALTDLASGQREALQVLQICCSHSKTVGYLGYGRKRKAANICEYDENRRDIIVKVDMHKPNLLCFQHFPYFSSFFFLSSVAHPYANTGQHQFTYGYEYQGSVQSSVMTPLSERAMFHMLAALAVRTGGFCTGPERIGKKTTIKELSLVLGRALYFICCSEALDHKTLSDVCKGVASSGCLVCFDSIDRMRPIVLSEAAHLLGQIHEGMKALKGFVRIQFQEIPLNSLGGYFATSLSCVSPAAAIPHRLLKCFRIVSITKSSTDLIVESLFKAAGNTPALVIASCATTFSYRFKPLFPRPDIKILGASVSFDAVEHAGNMKSERIDALEDRALVMALHRSVIPRLTGTGLTLMCSLMRTLWQPGSLPVPCTTDEKEVIAKAIKLRQLSASEGFTSVVQQLTHLIPSYQTIAIVGQTGCGKSESLQTSLQVFRELGYRVDLRTIFTQALDSRQLLGHVNMKTGRGIANVLYLVFRNRTKKKHHRRRWFIKDGKIDAQQMECMQAILRNNGSFILPHSEQFKLPGSVKLFWELASLENVSPAVICCMGILNIPTDTESWKLCLSKWLLAHPTTHRHLLQQLTEEFLDLIRGSLRTPEKNLILYQNGAIMIVISKLLSLALHSMNCSSDKRDVKKCFLFSCVWAFGGTLESEHKAAFDLWWRERFRNSCVIPEEHQIWDYYIDTETCQFVRWSDNVPPQSFPCGQGISSQAFVHTIESEQLFYLTNLLSDAGHPVVLAGETGCGKSAVLNEYMQAHFSGDVVEVLKLKIHMCRSTSSRMLWGSLFDKLEWQYGTLYTPFRKKKLMCFVDDLNSAQVDGHGSQPACELMRQLLDCGGGFDPVSFEWRTVKNVAFLATVNTSCPSSPRLLRHFAVFRCSYPSCDDQYRIFSTLLNSYFLQSSPALKQSSLRPPVTLVTVETQDRLRTMFLRISQRGHYIFTLRDLAKIFRNLCLSLNMNGSSKALLYLWRHECDWVYGHRLASYVDYARYKQEFNVAVKKVFADNEQKAYSVLVSVHHSNVINLEGGLVTASPTQWQLRKLLEESVQEHNKTNPRIAISFYRSTMELVCRLTRNLLSPHEVAHTLLCGEGCPGMAIPVTKLAAHLCGFSIVRIHSFSRDAQSIDSFKSQLVDCCVQAGIQNLAGKKVLCLMNEERLDKATMVYFTHLVVPGSITHLFSSEQLSSIINEVRSEALTENISSTKEAVLEFFVQRVTQNLRCVLICPSTGCSFSQNCQEFPIFTNTVNIYFVPHWSRSRLVEHALYHVDRLKMLTAQERENICHLLASMHLAVGKSDGRGKGMGRFGHLTNSTYESFARTFVRLFDRRHAELVAEHRRIEETLGNIDGVLKASAGLRKASQQAEVILEEHKKGAKQILTQIGQDRAVAEQQVRTVREQMGRIEKLQRLLPEYQLAHARSVYKCTAMASDIKKLVGEIDIEALGELRAMQQPDVDTEDLMASIIAILKSPTADLTWSKGAKRQMANLERFLDELSTFDEIQLSETTLGVLEKYLQKPSFTAENMERKTGGNSAASSLLKWLQGAVSYHRV